MIQIYIYYRFYCNVANQMAATITIFMLKAKKMPLTLNPLNYMTANHFAGAWTTINGES